MLLTFLILFALKAYFTGRGHGVHILDVELFKIELLDDEIGVDAFFHSFVHDGLVDPFDGRVPGVLDVVDIED